MANSITRHIPNTVTCLNLFSGCIACVMAFHGNYYWALGFISLSAVLDFLDGLFARLLHAYSAIGKDLDSLADVISFGLAPAVMVFSILGEVAYPVTFSILSEYFPYLGFCIAVFSGLRLAKFNNDTRQSTSFIGLPVPANALFWASLIVGMYNEILICKYSFLIILILAFIFSGLLVSEIPMFSLKFKNLKLKENKIQFLFLFICLLLLVFFGITGLAACIVWYIVLSVLTRKKN